MHEDKSITIYLRIRKQISVEIGETLPLSRIAEIVGPEEVVSALNELPVIKIRRSETSVIVLGVLRVISLVKNHFPQIDIEVIGSSACLIKVKECTHPLNNVVTSAKVLFVCLLLFVGAALAIMNFHADVSMQQTHMTIYRLITGESNDSPLALQIPYSLGIGLGMILFFNHIFRKPLSHEPSPLELEMYEYEQTLNEFIQHDKELKESKKEKKYEDTEV